MSEQNLDTENRTTRLKRLRIRSWRRGMKEMDLILGEFADTQMKDLTEEELDAHETLMEEQDQDLYLWVSGAVVPPDPLKPAVQRIQQSFSKTN